MTTDEYYADKAQHLGVPADEVRRWYPAECIKCGSPTGPEILLDSEFPGWLCPPCYQALQTASCPECGGDGVVDSGGFTPYGEPINVPCDCREPTPGTLT